MRRSWDLAAFFWFVAALWVLFGILSLTDGHTGQGSYRLVVAALFFAAGVRQYLRRI